MSAPLGYGTVVVIGGGCYGRWYTQQLDRAVAKGALTVARVLVVDRDAACQVARDREQFRHLSLVVVQAEWADWLAQWLASSRADAGGPDMLVPSPLMPHLLLDWLVARAEARWPARAVSIEPLPVAPDVPWHRAAPDGRHYVSFAEWMCPVNCIEPARCPATRGPRDWSLPPTLEAFVASEGEAGRPLEGPIIFHCLHRTWGVGMIDADTLHDADAFIAARGGAGDRRFLIGTVSHCHGALGVLRVHAPLPASPSTPAAHVHVP